MTEEPRLHKPSGFFWAPLSTYSSYMYSCIALYFGKIKMNWTELNASLIFEIRATWNLKRVTANYSFQFAVSHENSDAKGLYWLTRLMQLAPSKGIRIRACGKFFACWIGNPGPWNPECHWQLIGIRNPSFIEKDLESSNWNPESTAWNSDSKNVLEGPYIRRCNDAKIDMVAETQRATRFPWLVFILTEITNVVIEKFKKKVSSLIEWYGVILLWNNELFCWCQETGYIHQPHGLCGRLVKYFNNDKRTNLVRSLKTKLNTHAI